MNTEEVVQQLFDGKKVSELAKFYHVNIEQIAIIKRSLNIPSAKIIQKIKNTPGFKEYFIELYNKCNTTKEFHDIIIKHSFFSRIRKTSISQRVGEIRNLFKLPPKMEERVYSTQYDRIKGYMIRNSKYCAKRRNIYFDLKYTDFELPKYCPILGIKLTYSSESNGNDPSHASLDRIDNSKGYIPGNVLVVSRLANAMKNEATFDQLSNFGNNIKIIIDYYKTHGTLGGFTDSLEKYEPRPLVSEPSQESLPELGC